MADLVAGKPCLTMLDARALLLWHLPSHPISIKRSLFAHSALVDLINVVCGGVWWWEGGGGMDSFHRTLVDGGNLRVRCRDGALWAGQTMCRTSLGGGKVWACKSVRHVRAFATSTAKQSGCCHDVWHFRTGATSMVH